MNLQESPVKALNHHGTLSLKFTKIKNKTRISHCYQMPPLKASRALYLHPKNKSEATVYMMESSGGLLAGDRNEFRIDVEDGADVCLIPQSATKIYPSFNGKWSSQNIDVSIGDHARLAWKTEAIIPFKMAKFHGNTTIRMANSASLLWGEILSPGRDKRGEKFQYGHVKAHFQIWMDEECLAYDALSFLPEKKDLGQMGVLESHLYVGTLWFATPTIKEINMQELNEKLQQVKMMKVAASLLDDRLVNVRWLTSDMVLLKQEMEKTWREFTSYMI